MKNNGAAVRIGTLLPITLETIAALSVTIAGMWTHDPWQRWQTTALLLDVELRADERLAYDHAAPVHFGHYWR